MAGSWPDGDLLPEAPPEAWTAQAITVALQRAVLATSPRSLAAEADLAHTTIYDLLTGRTYGDVITIARLEAALGLALWPRRY